jgi:ribosomal protein S18 acetylase RimI-like enzyme
MAGFARQTGPKDRHKGFLWGMFVDPTMRGKGVGAALVAAVCDHAAPRVEQVTLTVVTTNTPAIALYQAAGFQSYGVEPRALKSPSGYADEMLMVRYCRTDGASPPAKP